MTPLRDHLMFMDEDPAQPEFHAWVTEAQSLIEPSPLQVGGAAERLVPAAPGSGYVARVLSDGISGRCPTARLRPESR